MASARTNRIRIIVGVIVVGLVAAGFGAWWFLFRDDSAVSVESGEAAAARQEAIDAAAAASAEDSGDADAEDATEADETGDTPDPAGSDEDDVDDDAAQGVGANTGQADAEAAVGSATDGVWTVDPTIGIFGPECLEVVCSAGFVGFRINEELAGVGAKTVVGRTPAVDGILEIEGSRIVSAEIVADMTELLTDNPSRTAALRTANGGLETERFPEASFVLAEPIELGETPVEGAAVRVDAVGDLTVHGTTQRVTIPLTAELQAGLIVVFGTLEDMVLADYGIPKPRAAVVLSVEEVAAMELQLFFSRAG